LRVNPVRLVVVGLLLIVASCSSSEGSVAGESTALTAPVDTATTMAVTVAVGYVESEYFLSGTASAYTSAAPLSSDGMWTVSPVEPVPFTTRVVVRRPADSAKFSGPVKAAALTVDLGSGT
jgi:hypothetical protein